MVAQVGAAYRVQGGLAALAKHLAALDPDLYYHRGSCLRLIPSCLRLIPGPTTTNKPPPPQLSITPSPKKTQFQNSRASKKIPPPKWNPRIPESQNPRILESKNPRILESRGILESQNTRILHGRPKSQNPTAVESQNPAVESMKLVDAR